MHRVRSLGCQSTHYTALASSYGVLPLIRLPESASQSDVTEQTGKKGRRARCRAGRRYASRQVSCVCLLEALVLSALPV